MSITATIAIIIITATLQHRQDRPPTMTTLEPLDNGDRLLAEVLAAGRHLATRSPFFWYTPPPRSVPLGRLPDACADPDFLDPRRTR